MAGRSFDRELWRTRAWDRFQRELRSGAAKATLEQQWYVDTVSIRHLGRLVDWCTSKGLSVVFKSKLTGGVYDYNNKLIAISSAARPEKQLMYLLHECGHFLINSQEHHDRFGMGYPLMDYPEVNKSFRHKVACVEEEIEAWHRGWKLGKRLKLLLRKDAFDNLKLECLRTYLKWSVSRGA